MGKGNKPQKNDRASMKPKRDAAKPLGVTESVYTFPQHRIAM